jgi:hypothetical protein
LLLNRDFGGATPVIADANSMTYVLHKSLGDDRAAAWDADDPAASGRRAR